MQQPKFLSREHTKVIIEYFRDMKPEIIDTMVDKVCKKKTGFNRALYKVALSKSYSVVVAVMVTVLSQFNYLKTLVF